MHNTYKNRLVKIRLPITIFFVVLFCNLINAQWYWQNPKPQGNFIYDISFIDTDNGFAITGDGRILKTIDGGMDWTLIEPGASALVNGISFTDLNTGVVVGDAGVILRTTDGGSTWANVSNGTTANLSKICFSDMNNGWIVGNISGFPPSGIILKTTDGGVNWSNLYSGDWQSINGLYFTDANSGTVVGLVTDPITFQSSGMVLKTTDGGSTWVSQTSGTNNALKGVCFSDANNGHAVGESGTIIKTTDGGNTWVSQNSTIIYSLNDVSFTDANNGICVGNNGNLLTTTDGGNTWEPQISGVSTNIHIYTVHSSNANNGVAAGGWGVLISSTDGGITWVDNVSGPRVDFKSISFYDENNGMVVGPEGTILKTTNGGDDWIQLNSGTTTTGFTGVTFINSNIATVIGGGGVIKRTTDGGVTWINQNSGLTSPLNGVFFTSANTGIVVGSSGKIIRTTDGGNTWVTQASGLTNNLWGVCFLDNDHGYVVGASGKILSTTDGGTSWITLTSGTTQQLNSVTFLDSNNGYAVGYNGTILKTTDGGITWASQISGSTRQLWGVSFADLNNGIAVGIVGTILSTTDGGNTWGSELISGPDINSVFMINENTGYVSGDRGAIYKRGVSSPPTTFQLSVDVENGWNIVSTPGLHPVNQNVDTWWSGRNPSTFVFSYDEGYQTVTEVEPGKGYWLDHLGNQEYNTGDEWPSGGINIVPNDPINANESWNLIGGYHYNTPVSGITTTPGGLQTGFVFGYSSTSGYEVADDLIPGYGYWIELTGAGDINLPDPTFKSSNKLSDRIMDFWGRIIITDNAGKRYTLYAVDGNTNLNDYKLPPLPPTGKFDVRYGSGRFAEDLSAGSQLIEMSGIEHPVTVRVENMKVRLQDESGKAVSAELSSGEQITINNSSINKLMILSGEVLTPIEYALEQNYPNPFNPSTTLKFSLPEAAKVTLIVYNVLGQKVAELVNGRLEAGSYSYQWDAGNLSSGIYLYQLKTDNFNSIKKMLLLK